MRKSTLTPFDYNLWGKLKTIEDVPESKIDKFKKYKIIENNKINKRPGEFITEVKYDILFTISKDMNGGKICYDHFITQEHTHRTFYQTFNKLKDSNCLKPTPIKKRGCTKYKLSDKGIKLKGEWQKHYSKEKGYKYLKS